MTEAEKDPGIDEIMEMNIPPEHKAHYIANLAKHRGQCMDADQKTMQDQVKLMAEQHAEIILLRQSLAVRSPIDNLMIWLNQWAKS